MHRFDRHVGMRIPLLSAMNMVGDLDNETRSYLEFVDAVAPQEGFAERKGGPNRRNVFSLNFGLN